MERFDRVLDTAECTANTVKLQFNKEVKFDQVQSEWSWVNQQEENYIVLVTENARCNVPDGDPTVRQPWHVREIVFDDDSNTVTLSAEPKTWKTAFNHWNLKVSSHGLVPSTHHRALVKRIGYNGSASIDLARDFSTSAFTLEDEDTDTSGTVSCDPCCTTGSLDFDIDVTWWFFSGLEGYVTMTPNNIGAYTTMSVEADQEITTGLTTAMKLLTYTPSRIYIADLIDIGPNFKVDIAASIAKASAQVSASAGIGLTIPADATATLDFDDSSKNEWNDWTPEISHHVQETPLSASLSLEASLGLVMRVELDAQLLGYGLAAGLGLSAPTWNLKLTGFDEPGACDVSGNSLGLEYGYSVGFELDGFAGFGEATDMPNKFEILGGEWPIYEDCVPVDASPSAVPTASASASAVPPYRVPGNETVGAAPTAR